MSTTTTTTGAKFPAQFADLEPFGEWVLDTWRERYDKRLGSTMVEMQSLYDTMLPRLAEVLEYCNQFPLSDLPTEVRNLVLLTLSLGEASFPVDAWRQPRVPDTGAADMRMTREPLL